MSVGSTTSRNLSEAFSCCLRMAVAVSKNAIPLVLQNDTISSNLKRLASRSTKWLRSLKKICPSRRQ